MVKEPRARHSRTVKEPVTIELGPDQVSRLSEPDEQTAASAQETPKTDPLTEEMSDDPELTGQEATAEADTVDDGADADEPYDVRTQPSEPDIETDVETEPSPARRGAGSALLAGVAGGVIALILAGALQWSGLIPALGDAGGNQTALASLQADVDAMKQKMASFDAGALDAATIKRALAPLDKRVSALSDNLGQLKSDVASAKSASSAGGSATDADMKDMQARLAKVEQGLSAVRNAAPSTQAVDSLGQKVNTIGKTSAGNGDKLAKLEDNVAGLSKKVEAQAAEPKATVAIAASALKSAIDRGGSFAAELDTFAAVAPHAPEIGELRALAAKGVPTRAQLAAEAGPTAQAMSDATQSVPAGSGIFDRLLTSAKSLVKVRPVGTVEGDGTAARIARFQSAVSGGDLARAADEYSGLPEKAKAAGAAFMADVQARLKADALAQKALAGALKTG